MLLKHLKVLQDQELIRIFTRAALPTGALWEQETQVEIAHAAVAIILVTPDYLASSALMGSQLPDLLARFEDEGTAILPLLVRPSMFDDVPQLNRFKPFNRDRDRTLVEMARAGEKERFLVSVTKEVRDKALRRRERVLAENRTRLSAENEDLVRRVFEAYADGGMAALRDFIDPDLEWAYLGPALTRATPQAGHGRVELESKLRLWVERGSRAELAEIAPNGELVMVAARIPGIDAYLGRSRDDLVYAALTLSGGRIIALRQCRDRKEARRLTGIRE